MRLPRVIRHYANEQDVIARLRVLADAQGTVRIEGEQEVYNGKLGHLFNANYLG